MSYILQYKELDGWKIGKESPSSVIKWCDKHCTGAVTTTDSEYKGAFHFELESDLVYFTLYWQ